MFLVNKRGVKKLMGIANTLREKAPLKIHYTELGIILGISPSYAAQIAKQLARLFDDFQYERGFLIVGEVRK